MSEVYHHNLLSLEELKKREGYDSWRYRNKARSCTNSYAVPPPLSSSPHFKAYRRLRAKTHFTTSGNDTLCALRDREEIKEHPSFFSKTLHVLHVRFSKVGLVPHSLKPYSNRPKNHDDVKMMKKWSNHAGEINFDLSYLLYLFMDFYFYELWITYSLPQSRFCNPRHCVSFTYIERNTPNKNTAELTWI